MDSIRKLKAQLETLEADFKRLADDRQALLDRAEADGKRALTKDEQTAFDKSIADAKVLRTKIEQTRDHIDAMPREDGARGGRVIATNDPEPRLDPEPRRVAATPTHGIAKRIMQIPGLTAREANERAYRSGLWFLANLFGSQGAAAKCSDLGIPPAVRAVGESRAMGEASNLAGGYLVPDEFSATIIDLREIYGVYRQNTQVVPMGRDTITQPRRVSGLTVYAAGENPASGVTTSDMVFDNVRLTAKKWGTATRYSTELDEDAVVSIGDMLAGEIAYAFSNKEDDCGFNGDGTSTYQGIQGVRPLLAAGTSGTHFYFAGGSSSSGKDTWGEIVLGDFNNVMGLLPAFVYQRGQVKWYCSAAFFHTVMQNLMYAAGGNIVSSIAGGTPIQFLGFPVVISQVYPTVTAVTQQCCSFGALELGSMLGDRRSSQVVVSRERYVELDQIGIFGWTRFDINNHYVTPANAAGTAIAGTVVGLSTSTT